MAWLPVPLMLVKGVLLGLGAAVPIGPVNVEIARRTLRGGFLAGVALGCGAVTVDVTYAVLSSLGVRLLVDRPALYWSVTLLGIGLLTWIGVQCWIDAIRAARSRADVARQLELEQSSRPQAGIGYVTGLLMTLLNPMTLVFWFTVVPSLAGQHGAAPGGGIGAGRADNGQHAGLDLPMICVGV